MLQFVSYRKKIYPFGKTNTLIGRVQFSILVFVSYRNKIEQKKKKRDFSKKSSYFFISQSLFYIETLFYFLKKLASILVQTAIFFRTANSVSIRNGFSV